MRDPSGRFAKGTSGNPGGRPQGRGLEHEVRLKLAEQAETGNGVRRTRVERIAEILVSKAEGGDLRALEIILKRADRGDGAADPFDRQKLHRIGPRAAGRTRRTCDGGATTAG